MDRQEASGALASGGTFRATPTLLEILTPTGEVSAAFDTRYFDTVTRSGQTLSITRIGNSSINVTAASLAEAEALEQVLQIGVASPTPATPPAAPATDSAAAPPSGNDGMNSLLKWGCIGTLVVVGLMALCLIAGLLLFRDSEDDAGAEPEVSTSVTLAATATSIDESAEQVSTPPLDEPTEESTDATATSADSGEPTAADEPTAQTPDATATSADSAEPTAADEPTAPEPGAPGSTRANPVPFGEVADNGDWQVQVLDVVRGQEAFDRLLEANQFNEPPPEGHEFVLVNLRAMYTGDSEEPQDIDDFWLRSTGEGRVKHENVYPVNPEPTFDATLFNGGEVTGWTTVLAQEGEANLLLIFQDWLSFEDDNAIYLALEEGARLEPITGRLAEENDLGLQISNPVPLGESVVGENWEIQVIEYERGQTALDRVLEANQFNEEPEAGMEYVIVHIGARNVGVSPQPELISSFAFRITGDSGRVYDSVFVIDPPPSLEYEMYPGGEASGWITLQIPEDEQNLRLIYEPWLSFTASERYFALE